MNKQQRDQQDIWFRNPMVWLVILLPLSVVVASIITIGIAYKYAPTITPSNTSTSSTHSSASAIFDNSLRPCLSDA